MNNRENDNKQMKLLLEEGLERLRVKPISIEIKPHPTLFAIVLIKIKSDNRNIIFPNASVTLSEKYTINPYTAACKLLIRVFEYQMKECKILHRSIKYQNGLKLLQLLNSKLDCYVSVEEMNSFERLVDMSMIEGCEKSIK